MRAEQLERIRRKLAREAGNPVAGAGVAVRGDYDPNKPWDLSFLFAAKDATFWTEHVDKPALLFAARLSSTSQIVDQGIGAVRIVDDQLRHSGGGGHGAVSKRKRAASESDSGQDAPGPKKKKRKNKKKRVATLIGRRDVAPPPHAIRDKGGGKGASAAQAPDGKHYRTGDGKQVCWKWNKTSTGCSAVCASGREHVCEWCLGKHRSCDCPSHGEAR